MRIGKPSGWTSRLDLTKAQSRLRGSSLGFSLSSLHQRDRFSLYFTPLVKHCIAGINSSQSKMMEENLKSMHGSPRSVYFGNRSLTMHFLFRMFVTKVAINVMIKIIPQTLQTKLYKSRIILLKFWSEIQFQIRSTMIDSSRRLLVCYCLHRKWRFPCHAYTEILLAVEKMMWFIAISNSFCLSFVYIH